MSFVKDWDVGLLMASLAFSWLTMNWAHEFNTKRLAVVEATHSCPTGRDPGQNVTIGSSDTLENFKLKVLKPEGPRRRQHKSQLKV